MLLVASVHSVRSRSFLPAVEVLATRDLSLSDPTLSHHSISSLIAVIWHGPSTSTCSVWLCQPCPQETGAHSIRRLPGSVWSCSKLCAPSRGVTTKQVLMLALKCLAAFGLFLPSGLTVMRLAAFALELAKLRCDVVKLWDDA